MKLCLALSAFAALSSASFNIGIPGDTTFWTVIRSSSSTNTTLLEPVTTMTLTINSTMSGELTMYNNGFPSSTTTVVNMVEPTATIKASSTVLVLVPPHNSSFILDGPIYSSLIFDGSIYSSFIIDCLNYPFNINPHSSYNHDSDYEALQTHFDHLVHHFQNGFKHPSSALHIQAVLLVSMPSPRQSPGNTSTMSTFQPEFESTQQFDTATQSLQLPNLRSSAQRFSYYNPPQPEMHIDSSFVRDSFPDFTEKSPSPSPEASMSIEAGRGKRGSPKSFDMSDIPLPSDSLYDLHSTPPRSTRPTPKKTDSLRKEASLRRAHSSDKRANASQRRSLSDMHHKVRHESDSSFVGEDRPVTQTVQPRNTRFTPATLPTSYSHDQGLQSTATPQRPLQNPTATWTGTQTQASFMLPDLPNITELVSGVRKDGTPVFSRSQKSRSRFTSVSYNNPTITNTIAHANINSIAVPDEEKAIFASLQLLKDKVANLEAEKSEAQ
ncbi:hypothetical protein KCU98_g16660, partial [Aureobasidium melanogenum]